MALFFSAINCDPGTWREHYVCRQNTCIGVAKAQRLNPFEKKWDTIEDCSKKCGASELPEPEFLPMPVPEPQPEIETAPAPSQLGVGGIGDLNVIARDCKGPGKALTRVDHVSPSKLPLHGKTKIIGFAVVPKDLQGGNFTLKMVAGVLGLTLVDMTGDYCEAKSQHTLLGLMDIAWEGASCPIKAGTNVSVTVSVAISPTIPMYLADTTTTVFATSTEGETLFCLEIETTGNSKDRRWANSDIVV